MERRERVLLEKNLRLSRRFLDRGWINVGKIAQVIARAEVLAST